MNLLASALRKLADRLDPPMPISTETVSSGKLYFTTAPYVHETGVKAVLPIRRKTS